MKSSTDPGHVVVKRQSSGPSRQTSKFSSTSQYSSSLIDAVRLSKIEAVLSLLASGADPNCTDGDGRSVLQVAVECGGNITIFKELLKAGASPNKCNPNTNQTILHLAARKGYQVCVRALLQAEADVDRKDGNGNTPLMLALQVGNMLIVQELLQAGCDVNLQNNHLETPLHIAAKSGLQDVAEDLVNYGANISLADDKNQTPFYLACKGQQMELASFLLRLGDCDVNAQDTQTGRTSLHWAVEHGNKDLVRLLMHRGANPNVGDKDWTSAFLMALDKGQKSIAQYLLSTNKCDVSVMNRFNFTALHLVARDGHVDLLDLLVRQGQDVNVKGPYGSTPLMIAAFEGHVDIINRLFELGAIVTLTDRFRATALIHAIISPESDEYSNRIVCRLIRANIDVNQGANVQGLLGTIDVSRWRITSHLEARLYTPLEIAMLTGRSAAIAMLLKRGCIVPASFRKALEYRYLTANIQTENKDIIQTIRTTLRNIRSVKSLRELCRISLYDYLKGREPAVVLKHQPIERKVIQYLRFLDLEQIAWNLPGASLISDQTHDENKMVELSKQKISSITNQQPASFIRNAASRKTYHVGQKLTANGTTPLFNGFSHQTSSIQKPNGVKVDIAGKPVKISPTNESFKVGTDRRISTLQSDKTKRPKDFSIANGSELNSSLRQTQRANVEPFRRTSSSSNDANQVSTHPLQQTANYSVTSGNQLRLPSSSQIPRTRLKNYQTFESDLDFWTLSAETSPTGSVSSDINRTGSKKDLVSPSMRKPDSPKYTNGNSILPSAKANDDFQKTPGISLTRAGDSRRDNTKTFSLKNNSLCGNGLHITVANSNGFDYESTLQSPLSPNNLLSPSIYNDVFSSPSPTGNLLSPTSPISPVSPTIEGYTHEIKKMTNVDRSMTPRSRLPQPLWRYPPAENSRSPMRNNEFDHVTKPDDKSYFKRTWSLRK